MFSLTQRSRLSTRYAIPLLHERLQGSHYIIISIFLVVSLGNILYLELANN